MNILIVTQYFWPEDFRINDLAQGLRQRGHQVTVLTGEPNYPGGRFFPGYRWYRPAKEDYHGVEVLRVPLAPRGAGQGWRLALNYLSFALSASLLGPFRAPRNVDLIFVYEPSPITVGLPALVLKAARRVPIIFWVQDLWPESLSATGAITSPRILGWAERMVRHIYRGCDLILVQSEGFVSHVFRVGARPEQVRFFPNWAEDAYQPVRLDNQAPERAELPTGFRVMFAGNIGVAQDFNTILAAAGRLRNYRDIHWVILGDGRMKPWVEEQVAARGLSASVHLLGRHPIPDMPRYFALADALLVTLKRDPVFELTVPGKVQSYLACGRPVVAGMEGEGARVVRESGAGVTCPPEDPEALAGAVLSLYRRSPGEREAMGMKGRSYYEHHFERSRLFGQLEAWMSSLIQSGA